jgi:predicted DNA binding protein
MVKGFQSWNPNGTVSVVRLTEQQHDDFAGLTEHQMHAFATAWRLGYYDRPRKCTLAEVASELGVSRATISGHLGAVESMAHRRLAARLGLRSDGAD